MRILMIATSHDRLGESGSLTGVGLETFAGPYYRFISAGAKVTAASPQGGTPPIDPLSLREETSTPGTRRFATDPAAGSLFSNTQRIEKVDPRAQDALFFVGGHGAMWDFADNPIIGALLGASLRAGKPVAAVCHGVAAMCSGTEAAGPAMAAGRAITALSDSEEAVLGRAGLVPFSLQQRLTALGARYQAGADFISHVIVDRNLITGQNMRSAEDAAAALLRILNLQATA